MIGLTVEVGLILEPAGWISFVRFAMPQTTFFQSSKSPQSSTGHRSDGEEEAKGLQLYGYWLWGCVTGESFNCRELSIACLFVCLLVCSCLCSFACECLVVYCALCPVARQLLNLSSSLPFTWLGLIDAGLQGQSQSCASWAWIGFGKQWVDKAVFLFIKA